WLNLGATALLLPLLAGLWRRGGWTRRSAALFATLQIAGTAALLLHPVLAGLANDASSLGWSLAALIPPVWLAAIEIVARSGGIEWRPRAAGAPLYRGLARRDVPRAPLYGCG